MGKTDEFVTLLSGQLARIRIGGSVVQREVRYMAATLQLFKHVVAANLSALIDRMKQFSFEPNYAH